MPKQLSTELNTQILEEISRHPQGVTIDILHAVLKPHVSRRTLQRRLLELLKKEFIITSGQGKARTYRVKPAFVQQEEMAPSQERGNHRLSEMNIMLSPEGEHTRNYIQRPIQQRQPIAYNRTFLEDYHPNETFYLPRHVIEHLHKIGAAVGEERPAGTYAREILNRLIIDLSWASSRLEGNTYSLLDTQNLIEHGKMAEGKNRFEAQMILNHKAAIELLVDNADTIGFNMFTFLNLHAMLSDNLLADQRESGRLRSRMVGITGTVFQPLNIPQQLEHYFNLILMKADSTQDPFEQAFFMMTHIPYLQPFVDMNKRVSRLGANVSLIKHNLCPLSFVDVPEKEYVEGTLGVYELQDINLLRDVFIWAYERSCQRYIAIKQTIAEPDPVRLRYRETFIAVVGEIVRSKQPPSRSVLASLALSTVAEADLDRFLDLAMEDLENLYEGNISRYRLRLSEFREWQSSLAPKELRRQLQVGVEQLDQGKCRIFDEDVTAQVKKAGRKPRGRT
jgi:Fic family protein